jgi:hypothetical protein
VLLNHGKIFASLKKNNMSNNTEKFPQQDAPEKNTDNAFVQVGKDGQPVIPHNANDEASTKESASVKSDEKH